jgi:glycosyltransferase involved in cell wall biosynthesis
MRKQLLMITWRDIRTPFAGGAEILTHNILKRITRDYKVTVLSSAFPGGKHKEKIDNITYLRLGSARKNYIGSYNWRIYFAVFKYWWKNIRGKDDYDVVIEQINNVPFFYSLYSTSNTLLFMHQLCRKNWFYQTPFAIAVIGYFIFEPLYLFMLRKKKIITVSESSKKDLISFGFDKNNISIIPEASSIKAASSYPVTGKKKVFTLLSIGNIRPMKRTHMQIKAFEMAKRKNKNIKLLIAGDAAGVYGGRVLEMINHSKFRDDIKYIGKVTEKQKGKLMRACHAVIMTGEREGWGLVVTEAACQGTPAIVFDVHGLRDSVIHKKTGLICKNNSITDLASGICKLAKNSVFYDKISYNSWMLNKGMTFDQSAKEFTRIIEKAGYEKETLPALDYKLALNIDKV